MRVKRARFTRWRSADNPNGNEFVGAAYLTVEDRSAAMTFPLELAAARGVSVAWTEADWAVTENARERYVNGRNWEINSLPNNDEWDSAIILVLDGCAKLIEAIDRSDYSAEKLWDWIGAAWDGVGADPWEGVGGDHKRPGPQKDRLRAYICAVMERTEKIHAIQREVNAKTEVWVGDAWSKLVVRLGEQWRAKGLKPTVSKSDNSRCSAFVGWIAFLMGSLPKPLWQHMQGVPRPMLVHGRHGYSVAWTGNPSWGALSKEVSKALRDRERILTLIEGTR
jgi:hypothetical protein